MTENGPCLILGTQVKDYEISLAAGYPCYFYLSPFFGFIGVDQLLDEDINKLDKNERIIFIEYVFEKCESHKGYNTVMIDRKDIEECKEQKRKRMKHSERKRIVLNYLIEKSIEYGDEIIIPFIKKNMYHKFISHFNQLHVMKNPQILADSIWNQVNVTDNFFGLMKKLRLTESTAIPFILKSISEQGYIYLKEEISRTLTSSYATFHNIAVTEKGYEYIEGIGNPDSSKCFVAMWFDKSMNKIYNDAIEPAIKKAGYDPVRIDRTEHNNKIDDEIIAEIRRSKFIVADFTQGNDGARGGVYYEAGFARGMGLEVISTCRDDRITDVHFDTRQYNHILWEQEKLEDLKEALVNRIRAVIGQGSLPTD